jgi:hypothetical protein
MKVIFGVTVVAVATYTVLVYVVMPMVTGS